MQALFNTVLSMSLTGAFVILIVLAARLVLKRAPKKFSYILWAAVAFRLCCPAALSLPVSAVPEVLTSGAVVSDVMDTVGIPERSEAETAVLEKDHDITYGQSAYGGFASAASGTDTAGPETVESGSMMRAPAQIPWLPLAWLAGASATAVHAVLSCVFIRRRMRTAVRMEDNIWCSEHVRSPFILGYFRPRIYIPYSLDVETERYVLEHERCHLRRGDHIINTAAYLILCVHWFNPLCWVAFILMGRDMEMSCDEKVLDGMGDIRRDYSMSLLSFAMNRRFPAPSPLAFGETGVKARVKNTLNYKKPAFWIILAAVIICIAVAVCLLTNPVGIKFDFESNYIESASYTYTDTNYYLNEAQISELESRLNGIRRARRSDKYAGFTPAYSITAKRADGTFINACGYRFDDDGMVDISTDGKRYVVKDEDFCAYLKRVCTGGDTEQADDIGADDLTKLLSAAVIENLGDGWWKSGGLRTSGVYEAGAFEELGGSYDTDFGATVFYGICLYRLYDMDRICVDEFQTECAITVEDGAVTEFWMPGDGAYHDMDIAQKFPPDIADMIIECDDPVEFYQKYNSILAKQCDTDMKLRQQNESEKLAGRIAEDETIAEMKNTIADKEGYGVKLGVFQNGEYLGPYGLEESWNGHLEYLTESCNWRKIPAPPEAELEGSAYVELFVHKGWNLTIYESGSAARFSGWGSAYAWLTVNDGTGTVYDIVRGWFDEAEFVALGGYDNIPFTVPDSGQSYETVALKWAEQFEGVHLRVSEGSRFKYTEIAITDAGEIELPEDYSLYPKNTDGKPRFAFGYKAVFTPENRRFVVAGNTEEYRDDSGQIVPGKYVYGLCGFMYLTDDGWRCDGVGTGL